jgi:hypothetical protein
MPKIRMKAANPDAQSVVVEGKIQYDVKGGVVEVEEPHVPAMRGMGFTVMTAEDDRVLLEADYLAKHGHELYEQYLARMKGRLGDKFSLPEAPLLPPELASVVKKPQMSKGAAPLLP